MGPRERTNPHRRRGGGGDSDCSFLSRKNFLYVAGELENLTALQKKDNPLTRKDL